MFKRRSTPGQPIGTDLDWFVIPIRTIRLWGILLLVAIVVGGVAFLVREKTRRSPQDREAGDGRPHRGRAGRRVDDLRRGRRVHPDGREKRVRPGAPETASLRRRLH